MDTALPVTAGSVRTPSVVSSVVRWYLVDATRTAFVRYIRTAEVLFESFSVGFLLKTMFARWKGIAEAYPSKGFRPTEVLSTLCLNLTSRGIGAVVRLGVILLACVVQGVLAAAFLGYIVFWMLAPFLVPAIAIGLLLELFS